MISSIVLAAGLSSRMGHLKPLLPYGNRCVIEQVASVLLDSPVDEVLIVTGFKNKAIEARLKNLPVTLVFNPNYASGEMLASLQTGLSAVNPDSDAILLALGDQPAIQKNIVEKVVDAHQKNRGSIIIPSYNKRRGHPLIIPRKYWKEILLLNQRHTLRDFLRSINNIFHVEVYTSSILRDMDTMTDYHRELALMQDSSLVMQNS
jgi:molybdenum cofactor cytidylyltransferase